jgi:hypothetical protein
MKVVIAGSRTLDHTWSYYMRQLEELTKRFENDYGAITLVVSGRARGPDLLGEAWADANGIGVARFPAKWDLHGKAAGPIRNQEMGDFCDGGIVMWDGKSSGSKHMAEVLRKQKKPFILDIFEPINYSYEHGMDGTVIQVAPDGERRALYKQPKGI